MPAAHSARAPAMSAAELSPDMPKPDLTWIILDKAPRFTDDDSTIEAGTDLLLEDEHPLLPSTVTLHKRLRAGDKTSIVAVDPSGRFLIFTDHAGVEPDYLLCDAGTRLATRLPSRPDIAISPGNLRCSTRLSKRVESTIGISPRGSTGLIANRRRDGDFIIADLFPPGSTHHKSLVCYSTTDSAWVVKALASSPHHPPWETSGGVLAHDGKLWWVDYKHGVLSCDPSLDRPDLRYLALPEPDDSSKHRCVGISQGEIRCAEITVRSGNQKIVVWTLGSNPQGAVWTIEYEEDLEAYTGLPRGKVPQIGLMHPHQCHIIYLLFDLKLFVLDTRIGEKAVLGATDYASKSIVAWELPQELVRFSPGAPLVKEPTMCLVCEGTTSGNYACDTCQGRIGLLLKKLKTSRASANIDSLCLRCGSMVGCTRKECAGFQLPLSRIGSDWFGWVTGREIWALLFKGVEVNKARTVGMPIRLHPPSGNRCAVCSDCMGTNADTLYRTCECCSIECCKEREPCLQKWAPVLLSLKFTGSPGSQDSFCTTCAKSFCKDSDIAHHEKHTWFGVVLEEDRACIEVVSNHSLTGSLSKTTPLNKEFVHPSASSSILIPLRPRGTRRCVRCRTCLVEGGGRTCSLGCVLSVPVLQPRTIQLRSRVVSKKF